MTFFRTSAGVAMASVVTALLLAAPARAAGQDYRFEVVQTQPAGKNLTDVAVKLTHIPDGKPVVVLINGGTASARLDAGNGRIVHCTIVH